MWFVLLGVEWAVILCGRLNNSWQQTFDTCIWCDEPLHLGLNNPNAYVSIV